MIDRGRVVLIGHPVAHSLSSVMHDAMLEALGSSLRHEKLDVPPDALAATLDSLKAENAAGNFTLPHKVRALDFIDRLTTAARRAHAVNTFWLENGGVLFGDNTDVHGFDAMARAVAPDLPASGNTAVLGSGGGASAVLAAIEGWPGGTVRLYARNRERASFLKQRFKAVSRIDPMSHPSLAEADIVVNTTSLGLFDDDPLPVNPSILSEGAIVLDIVYSAARTRLVRLSRERGLVAADGLTMLLHQAVASFERWFGVRADSQVMGEALVKRVRRPLI